MYNNNIYFMKVECDCADWVSLAKDSASLLSFINTAMNSSLP